ncbi:MAG: recombinase zinc beta ribbon domain-containing protein, partial [Opitutaceae bacterium]
EQNQRMLLENSAVVDKMRTAVKGGAALLTGLLRCGHCGRPMQTDHFRAKRKSARYLCISARNHHGGRACIGVGATRVDQAVSAAVLPSLETVATEATLAAERLASEQRQRRHETVRLALEKARYEADRCRWQFEAVEPENRLVATELERRWNAALAEVARLDAARQAQEHVDAPLAAEEMTRLRALGADVTAVWNHPAAPLELKKRILRTVIEEIIVRVDPCQETTASAPEPEGKSPEVDHNITKENPLAPATVSDRQLLTLTFHWAGGAHTSLQMDKPSCRNLYTTSRDAIELIRELAAKFFDDRIAFILNRGGHRTGKGLLWKAHSVIHVREKYNIPACKADRNRTWLSLKQAAEKLEICSVSVRKLITAGILPAEQIVAHAPWFIAPESLRLPQVTRVVEGLKKTGLLVLPDDASANLELSLS